MAARLLLRMEQMDRSRVVRARVHEAQTLSAHSSTPTHANDCAVGGRRGAHEARGAGIDPLDPEMHAHPVGGRGHEP